MARAPSAEGELAVHPSGLARLELRNSLGGFVERHLLQSNSYQASRNGELISDPHPFLPPVFLLQASSGEGLAAALTTFGVDGREVVLGKMGGHDCYVFGGRAIGPGEEQHPLPSLWIDVREPRAAADRAPGWRRVPLRPHGRVWRDPRAELDRRARPGRGCARGSRSRAPRARRPPPRCSSPAG
jgi:hypothetical protein